MMVIRDLQITDVDEGLAAGTIAFGMGNPGGGPDHRRGPLIQAGTIYKRQGRTLDHTYLYHTHHWRSAASYVALTRQRERAQVFVARETARDAPRLARQMAREEIKAASVAWATLDELTPALRERATRDKQGELAADRQTELQPRRRADVSHGLG